MSKKGYTLVEILIVIGVFGLLTIVGANFLVQSIQNNNRVTVGSEVRQNASAVLSDVERELRNAQCVNYYSPAGGSTALLRIAADPSGSNCSYNFPSPGTPPVAYTAYTVEYYQDAKGIVTKAATSAANTQISFGPVTSGAVAILNCASPSNACGLQSGCAPGLLVSSPSFPALSGSAIGVSVIAQQPLGVLRLDFCASTSLSSTIVMRNL